MADLQHAAAGLLADLDNDGDLDLFVGNYGDVELTLVAGEPRPSCLYENLGDGTFADRSDRLPPEVQEALTFGGGFHDLDGDLAPELYVVNDLGGLFRPNALLWNRGGSFELDGGAAGLDVAIAGMGLAVGDVNGDEIPDLIVPGWREIAYLESVGGTWFDAADLRGVVPDQDAGQYVGWGTELADMDNDGDHDALLAFGYIDGGPDFDNPLDQPDALFVQAAAGGFHDEAAAWGIADPTITRAFGLADFDDDGWLDYAPTALGENNALYLSRCGREAWLRVRLVDETTPNPRGIGARVTATVAGGRKIRWMRAGGTNFASGGPPELHFGLGFQDTIGTLELTWPDGEVAAFDDVDSRQVVVLRRR